MARMTAPETIRDARASEAARAALDNARDALDNARRSIDSVRDSVDGNRLAAPDIDIAKVSDTIRRTIDELVGRTSDVVGRSADTVSHATGDVAARMPDTSPMTDRLPSRADVLAAVPGAIEVARRVPSMRELRSSAKDASASARDVALDVARRTPLRDHPAVRRGPGPLGILARLGLASLLAGLVAVALANRERIREAVVEARTRAARLAAERRGALGPSDSGTWSDTATGNGVTVDEVLIVERIDAAAPPVSDPETGQPASTLAGDGPAEDLDAVGWGTEGRPTAPRQMSSDVASMTTPSRMPGSPDELGE